MIVDVYGGDVDDDVEPVDTIAAKDDNSDN